MCRGNCLTSGARTSGAKRPFAPSTGSPTRLPPTRLRTAHLLATLTATALAVAIAGCAQEMANQPRVEPLETSRFFADQMASRKPPAGTVARGLLQLDSRFETGQADGRPIDEFPEPVTVEQLRRGRERFNIFCAPCHDQIGNGQGMVVRRGFPRPPSYHDDRLRKAPVGHLFDVVTRGFGRMPDYASQIPPHDRWAIVAYVRALQTSQHAEREQLSEQDRARLDSALQDGAPVAEEKATQGRAPQGQATQGNDR